MSEQVNKGLILAAGAGSRLCPLTFNCPKVLLPVNNNKRLISYPLKALVSAGISEIAIVVGYFGDRVMKALGNGSSFGARLQYIFNPDYISGNAISIYRARDWAQGEPIVLCMGDHLIEKKIVKRLIHRQTLNETLCVDYIPATYHQLAEATKVAVDGAGSIKDIGKALDDWDALDTGVYLLTEKFFQAIDELIGHIGQNIEISDVVCLLLNQGNRFDTCNVSGCFWLDVDTEEDLKIARIVDTHPFKGGVLSG